jgi:acyl-CoA thioesterase
MTLDEMLEGAAAGRTEIAAGWSQGRATFGGLVAGLLVARAAALCGERPLRAASFAFVGPASPGPADLDGAVLRAGRSVTQVEAKLAQDGETRAALLASFGDERPSAIALAGEPPPPLPAPDAIPPLAPIPGVTPEFFEHFDVRFAAGAPPFSGAAEPDFGGWMAFAQPPARFGARELVVLADAWPPAVAPLLDRPAPASTLSWTLELTDGPYTPFWQYAVHTHTAGGGYALSTARIWDQEGNLRAISHQTVAVFA